MAEANKGNDARRALRLCAEMEREMGGLYRDLAAAHAADAGLAQLWLKTAHEEDNHARQFELALQYDEKLGTVLVTSETAKALVGVVQEMRWRLAEGHTSPAKALRTAIELEERFADFHMTTVTTFGTPGLRKLFEAMMAADRDHVAALRAELAGRT
jgi:rubrerythrin